MKLKGLILGDIRQQYKYGFYALYTLFTLVYITVLRILPMPWKELCTTTLIFSDPVLIGLMFMGAIILFEKSEKVMQALAVSPISIHAYILSKVISIGLISLLSGVLIALFSGMEHSYIHLAVGIMLGSALFTLVGISLSAFISTMNNFMLIMVPTLIISVAPISVYTMGYKSGAMLLHPSISLIELMSGNISVISLIAISIWCIAMYIFSCLSVKNDDDIIMNQNIISFKMFIRNIFSDGMLSAIICIPLILAAIYRFVFPLIVQHYPMLKDFSLYYPILDLFLAIMCPYMICFASVLVVLDETDMKINRYITITPLGKKGYLISRLLIPVLFAAIVSFVLLSFCSVSDMSLWTTFIISILATILSVVAAMIILAYAGNKVEGMALAKVSALVMVGLIIPFVITDSTQYVFSFLPSFWIAKFLISNNYWFILPTIFLSGGLIYILYNRYSTKI